MSQPVQKVSKSRRNMRRAHDALVEPQHIEECSQCGASKMRHRVCANCGYHRGRHVLKHLDAKSA